MVDIIFNIKKLSTKIFLALISIMIFTILYVAVPNNEFTKKEEDNNKITLFDYVYYSVVSQVGVQSVLIPVSIRTKILTMLQLFIGYTIILIG
jgi:hypothetical protein